MCSCSFLSVSLSGVSMILLLMAGCETEQLDFTPPPDYDYSATFNYSFYSNASDEDLDKFSERFIVEETATVETSGETTESDAVSLQPSQEIWMFVWTLMILNLQQLQQTL
ncbi:uncharacterized protein si:ch211-191i18.2 [Betta splendens]|uniref:Uncharacterized protein si:ch211-191i18.2 n=1 Tax=Betta splendens TaxID=158456 RepID=A0A8M1HKB3_BETSP|nr:uncharacterized protein si:ch211-191i18.2 [Betta splendens]